MHILDQIVFIDIETVSAKAAFEELDERFQELWSRKHKQLFAKDYLSPEDSYPNKAAIYAEYGKVITVGMAYLVKNENKEWTLKGTVLKNDNEHELLSESVIHLNKLFKRGKKILCAHNGKEFDFPYLCRRILANRLTLPTVLDIQGKKPWEISHIDTLEMWKFGDRKAYTSLDLLAAVFNIDTSKSTLDGSKVGEAYYKFQQLDEIAEYCLQDVIVLAQIYLALQGFDAINKENIICT